MATANSVSKAVGVDKINLVLTVDNKKIKLSINQISELFTELINKASEVCEENGIENFSFKTQMN